MFRIKQKGFTLIELLVVIAIIALLVSILMPALNKVREQAKAVTCQTQLRQFGIAWHQYAEANDDFNIVYSWSPGGFWFYQLAPYLGDKNFRLEGGYSEGAMHIMHCPSCTKWKPEYEQGWGWGAYGAAKFDWQWRATGVGQDTTFTEGSYVVNSWMVYSSGMDQTRVYRKFSKAKSNTPLASDGGWVDGAVSSAEAANTANLVDLQGAGYGGGYRMGTSSARLLLDRHSMAIDIVLQDTHVERVPLRRVWSFQWNRKFVPVEDLILPGD